MFWRRRELPKSAPLAPDVPGALARYRQSTAGLERATAASQTQAQQALTSLVAFMEREKQA